ncbi:MAG: hypothetical protein KUG78_08400 [Kangiellaceae bacterium]|nr:hypothetical protein [Kangiellaceae bacterium]
MIGFTMTVIPLVVLTGYRLVSRQNMQHGVIKYLPSILACYGIYTVIIVLAVISSMSIVEYIENNCLAGSLEQSGCSLFLIESFDFFIQWGVSLSITLSIPLQLLVIQKIEKRYTKITEI